MHTNYRKDAERSIGQDLSGPGGSSNYIDIDIGIDMMTKVERRSSYRQPGKINAWAGATELQSNLQVEAGDRSFYLHKFPLLSRSGRLNRLVFESRDTGKIRILLPDIPGGSDAFEMAARFLYGGDVELTPTNVGSIRCAAEYLEMSDSLGEGNLISKTEEYLNRVVLGSWKDSISVLKTCSDLKPWAEELEIVRRCSESVAWKASTDPHGIRWSFSTKAGAKESPRDWWFDDVSSLYIDTFIRVIHAVNMKGMNYTMVAAAVLHYAQKWLGLSKETYALTPRSKEGSSQGSVKAIAGLNNQDFFTKDANKEQHKKRAILQGIVSLLPSQADSISNKFLLKLLRVACMVNAGAMCKTDLARRIGVHLDEVSVNDLLLPAYSTAGDSTYDIDVVYQIVEHYLQEQTSGGSPPLSPRSSSSLSHSILSSTTSQTGTSITSASSVTTGSASDRSGSGSSSSTSDRTVSGSSVSESTNSGTSSSRTSSESSRTSRTSSESSRTSLSSLTSTPSSSGDESVKLEKKFHITEGPTRKPQLPAATSNVKVARLLEVYLEEVSKDSSIPLAKFAALADLYTEFPRDSDDSIYRSIDSFLRSHPALTEQDRKKLCRVMDVQALSLSACTHAASNERLPLRFVVQVLFSEQVKIRNAITGSAVINDKGFDSTTASFSSTTSRTSSSLTIPTSSSSTGRSSSSIISLASSNGISVGSVATAPSVASAVSSLLPGGLTVKEGLKTAISDIELLRSALQEIELLKSRLSLVDNLHIEMDSMNKKFQDLAHDYTGMTHQVEELTKASSKNKSGWSSGWKKMAKPFHSKDHHHFPKDWELQREHTAQKISTEKQRIDTPPLHQMKIVHPTDLPAIQPPLPKAPELKIETPLQVKDASPAPAPAPAAIVNDVTPTVPPPKSEIAPETVATEAAPKEIQQKVLSTPGPTTEPKASSEQAKGGSTHVEPRKSHHKVDATKIPERRRRQRHRDSDTESVSSESSFVSTSSAPSLHQEQHRSHHRSRDTRAGHHRRDHREHSEEHRRLSVSERNGHRGSNPEERHHHSHHRHRDGSEHNNSASHHNHGHHHRDGSEDRHHRRSHHTPEHTAHHHRKDHHSSDHRPHSKDHHASTASNHSNGHNKDGSEHHGGHHRQHHHHRKTHHRDRIADTDYSSSSDSERPVRHRRHS